MVWECYIVVGRYTPVAHAALNCELAHRAILGNKHSLKLSTRSLYVAL